MQLCCTHPIPSNTSAFIHFSPRFWQWLSDFENKVWILGRSPISDLQLQELHNKKRQKQMLLRSLQRKDERQWSQDETWKLFSMKLVKDRKRVLEMLRNLNPWRYFNINWTRPWATCYSPCFEQEIGLADLWRPLLIYVSMTSLWKSWRKLSHFPSILGKICRPHIAKVSAPADNPLKIWFLKFY